MCEAPRRADIAGASTSAASVGKLVVRRATSADAPAVRAILRDTFETTWRPNMTPAAVSRHVLEDPVGRYVEAEIAAFTVAEIDGRVVGMVDWRDDFVEALHVCSDYQRMGTGRRLVTCAEREIAHAGFDTVRVETDTFNERSRSFYAALGYVEIDRYPDTEWDSGFTTILLEKRLR
jgi:N-acetylglutamate synthase-like GNAT family acetyltransferase